jgi:hypothetical protein
LSGVGSVPENYGLVRLERQADGSYSRADGEIEVLIKNKRMLYDPLVFGDQHVFSGSPLPTAAGNIMAYDATANQTAWAYPPPPQ